MRKVKRPDSAKIEKKHRRRRIFKRILLGLTLVCLAFTLFGAAYVLRLDAWQEFDAGKILGAPQSLLVYDAEGNEVSCLSGAQGTRINISVAELPVYVRNAFLAAEDTRFYEHSGIDFKRIVGAALADIKAGSYEQGASTISQQLIKLSHLNSEKLMSRKLEEAVLAYQMERQFTKDQILEMYLNYVYFGGGYHGIETASRGYFGVHAKDLSVAQAALLAGILKSPSNYAPHIDLAACTERRNHVLDLMEQYGYLTQGECAQAQAEKVELKSSLNEEKRGYYIDLALEQARSALNISMDQLLTGGYRIHTALDSALQTRCEEILQDNSLFPQQAEDAQAALVVVSAQSGGVAALMGGRKSTAALEYNRATRIRRQPGSVIKPILVYAPALEDAQYTTVSMLLDEPADFDGYQPQNFGQKYRGWVTLREAVANSLNVPAVKVLSTIGVETGKRFAQSLGIPFDDKDAGLALALGGFTYGVSPYQLAGAYAAFAAGGVYSTPSLVLSVTNSAGNVLYSYQPEKKRVMSEANAYILSDMLQSTVKTGTGKLLSELGIPLAGKTGTNGEDGGSGNRDAWMAAYNPAYAAVVWMGYDDSANGKTLPKDASGGKYPAMILSEVFSSLYEGQAAPAFAMPAGVKEVKLDLHSLSSDHIAVLANALTPEKQVLREVFAQGTEPADVSDYWVVPSPPSYFSVSADANTGAVSVTFQSLQSFVLYRLYREDAQGIAVQLGEWPGSTGTVSYTDTGAEPGKTYSYYVIPAHPELTINGTRVVGPPTRKIEVQIPVNPFLSLGE